MEAKQNPSRSKPAALAFRSLGLMSPATGNLTTGEVDHEAAAEDVQSQAHPTSCFCRDLL